jgi:hypothetical protein
MTWLVGFPGTLVEIPCDCSLCLEEFAMPMRIEPRNSQAEAILDQHPQLKAGLEAQHFQGACWIGDGGKQLYFRPHSAPCGVLIDVDRLSDPAIQDWLLEDLESIARLLGTAAGELKVRKRKTGEAPRSSKKRS